MGYRIIAGLAGLQVSQEDGRTIDRRSAVARLPRQRLACGMGIAVPRRSARTTDGRDVPLDVSAGITDAVTSIDPARTYAVRQPTAHPIHEHARVRRFARCCCEHGHRRSHARRARRADVSSRTRVTPRAASVHRARMRWSRSCARPGRRAGCIGAKITGGGSGGTVAVLARRGSRPPSTPLRARYTRETGRPAAVIAGSSDGADRSGATILNGL